MTWRGPAAMGSMITSYGRELLHCCTGPHSLSTAVLVARDYTHSRPRWNSSSEKPFWHSDPTVSTAGKNMRFNLASIYHIGAKPSGIAFQSSQPKLTLQQCPCYSLPFPLLPMPNSKPKQTEKRKQEQNSTRFE